jgi:hypothetical protein
VSAYKMTAVVRRYSNRLASPALNFHFPAQLTEMVCRKSSG